MRRVCIAVLAAWSMACASAVTSPVTTAPSVTPPVTVPVIEAPVPVLDNLNLWVLDGAARPIPGATCTVLGDTRTVDGGGFVNFAIPGPVTATCSAPRFTAAVVDLPPGDHRLHLPVAPLPDIGEVGAPPWVGQLRLSDGDTRYEDATGTPILPVCAHYGEAFSAFAHDKRVDGIDVAEQLARIKRAGYDCIRSWSILGYYDQNRPDQPVQWKAWAGKEVTPFPFTAFSGRAIPATPNYYQQHADFAALLQRTGLAWFESRGDMVGQAAATIRAHTDQAVLSADRAGISTWALAEACNECWQNGAFTPAELKSIVAPYKARGALTAHSTAEQAEEPDAIAAISTGASIYTVHGLRVGTPSNILEHIFSLGYFTPRTTTAGVVPRLGIQGEPAGPGSGVSVGRVNDPELLGLMAATSLLSRQWWVYMSGYGVFWDGRIESQPGFYVVPRIRTAIAAFAPDVMSWNLYHGGRTEAALVSPTGYADDPGNREGPARIFNAVRPDRRAVVAVIEGGHGAKRAENRLDCTLTLDVIGIADDETLTRATFTLAPRASLPIDYQFGRLLLGRCQ